MKLLDGQKKAWSGILDFLEQSEVVLEARMKVKKTWTGF